MTRFPMGYSESERQRESVPGRDGQRQDMSARVMVSGPKEPPRYAAFDVANAIEKMRLKGSLGKDEAETIRRYKAHRLFARLFFIAHPGARCPMMGERVDGGGGGGEDAKIRSMDANRELVVFQKCARGMTLARFLDLEAICAKGYSFRQHGKNTGRHHYTVRDSVMIGLDAIADYEPWQRRLDAEPVMKIEEMTKRKRAA
jgi:hypothetical protein